MMMTKRSTNKPPATSTEEPETIGKAHEPIFEDETLDDRDQEVRRTSRRNPRRDPLRDS